MLNLGNDKCVSCVEVRFPEEATRVCALSFVVLLLRNEILQFPKLF